MRLGVDCYCLAPPLPRLGVFSLLRLINLAASLLRLLGQQIDNPADYARRLRTVAKPTYSPGERDGAD